MATTEGSAAQGGTTGGASAQQSDREGWQAQMQEQISRLADQVQRQSAELADMAQSGIRDWPLGSVLGAFALGVGIGFLLGRQR